MKGWQSGGGASGSIHIRPTCVPGSRLYGVPLPLRHSEDGADHVLTVLGVEVGQPAEPQAVRGDVDADFPGEFS